MKSSSDGAEAFVYRSRVRVNRILALLILTGALYILLLVRLESVYVSALP